MNIRLNARSLVLCSLLLLSAAVLPLQAQAEAVVVNGASFAPGFPVSPGSIASAFADQGVFNGAPAVPGVNATAIPLATSLAGVQVRIADIEAPLIFVSEVQINFQVPGAAPVGRHRVSVTVNGSEVGSGFVDVIDAAPGLFFNPLDQINEPGAVVNPDGSINGPNNPANRGDTLLIFGTGQGPLDREVADGDLPSGITRATTDTRVLISVADANVAFSGLAPTFVGLWQLNVRIPDRPFITGRVPLLVIQDGLSSNAVSIWVAQ